MAWLLLEYLERRLSALFCYLFKDFRVIFAKSQWENFCHIAPYINIALFYCSVHWCGCGCRHRFNHRCSCGGLLCYEEQKVSPDFALSPLNELLNQKVHLFRFVVVVVVVFVLFCFVFFCNRISYNSQHFFCLIFRKKLTLFSVFYDPTSKDSSQIRYCSIL